MASKGTRYQEERIIRILTEVESGTTVAEVCRQYSVSEQTVYRWRGKYVPPAAFAEKFKPSLHLD